MKKVLLTMSMTTHLPSNNDIIISNEHIVIVLDK